MKKFTALLLMFVMLLSLAACGGGGGGSTVLDGQDPNEPLTKDDVITMMIPSSPSWPVRDDWKLYEYMADGSGATLDIISVPTSDAGTKYSIMFAAREELPDVLAFDMVGGHTKYAGEGLIAFDDLEAYMPTYNAWKDSLSEEEYDVVINPRKRADGKIYYTPGTGREGKTRVRAWPHQWEY